jgi:hypothetical protein
MHGFLMLLKRSLRIESSSTTRIVIRRGGMYGFLMLLIRSLRIERSTATLIVTRREVCVIIPSPTSASASAATAAWCKRFQKRSATGPNTKLGRRMQQGVSIVN